MYNLHPTIVEMVAEVENRSRAKHAERRRVVLEGLRENGDSRSSFGAIRHLLSTLRQSEPAS
jgi:hypothetical protein